MREICVVHLCYAMTSSTFDVLHSERGRNVQTDTLIRKFPPEHVGDAITQPYGCINRRYRRKFRYIQNTAVILYDKFAK